ncbi:hypothetical protein LshimejAT787_0410940 [Lyophyllum shimeji]|uniref:Uncharacterized protein n=1 Tax=Lyophyllum shimeji TaxID=47721 RepID=A0A9P3PMA0_LYOSH|nr:hypothetical protein LshimejAT787_0410940 [Lyophyllum shimeji]
MPRVIIVALPLAPHAIVVALCLAPPAIVAAYPLVHPKAVVALLLASCRGSAALLPALYVTHRGPAPGPPQDRRGPPLSVRRPAFDDRGGIMSHATIRPATSNSLHPHRPFKDTARVSTSGVRGRSVPYVEPAPHRGGPSGGSTQYMEPAYYSVHSGDDELMPATEEWGTGT